MWRFACLFLILMCSGIQVNTVYAAATEAVPADSDDEGEVEVDDGADDATEAAEGGVASKKTIYIPLKPAFVVNYGGSGKLSYIKADVSVRVNSSEAARSVRHHMPYLRNNLVMLFSAQTEESISTQDGKEALRHEALKEIQDVLMFEERQEGVVDLYFNNFLIQK